MTSARIPEGDVALVLSGAVAKGAFSVGAIGEFAARGWPIRRIAATSSGALTAAVLGAGIATGRLQFAAEVAKSLWLDHAAWSRHHPSFLESTGSTRAASRTPRSSSPWSRKASSESSRALRGACGPRSRSPWSRAACERLPAADDPLPRYELDKDFDERPTSSTAPCGRRLRPARRRLLRSLACSRPP